MVNYSTNVLKDVWVAISDSKDYVLQNKGTGSILVKASDTMPTDAVGAIEVQGKKWITSKELYGNVWCSAVMEVQPIAYGIGNTVSSEGGSGGGTTIDRELVVTTYTCKTAFTGASVGDTITQTQIIDVTGTPSTVSSVWRNQSTSTDLASAPTTSNITLAGSGIGLTDAQLRASALNVNVANEIEIKNDSGNPIITKTSGLVYPTSTNNSSTVQIPAGGSFTGTPETIMELQAAQVHVVCDQPYKVEIFQYIDAAGLKQTSVDTFSRAANAPLNENITLPGNYFKLKVTNLGTSATTSFEVNTTFGIMNTQPRALTNSGNLPVAIAEGTVVIKGANDKWRDSFETDDTTLWTKTLDAGDYHSLGGNVQGAGYGQLSKSALTKGTVSSTLSKNTFTMPARIGYGLSLSQRISGELYSVAVVSVDPITGLELVNSGETTTEVTDTVQVSQMSVTSNFATIYTGSTHNFRYDDLVVISGATDTRVNVLGRISVIVNSRCVQMSLTIANATYNVGPNAVISKVNLSNGNPDIAGIAYYDTVSANANYYHRTQGSTQYLSASSSFGTSYTDALVPSAQAYTYNMQPRFNSEIVAAVDVLRFGASLTDNASLGTFYKRTQVVPDPSATYALKLKATTLPNKAVPISIASATKSASTTATVVTDVAHGLETGAYVRIYGANDQGNWGNVTTEAAITKVSATSFTVTWGTSTTGTIYGGYVIPVNGTGSVTGAVNVGVLGTTWANGKLFVGTSGTPSVSVGDTVRLVGLRDTAGNVRSNTSGRFRVAALMPNIMESAILTGANTTTSNATVTLADTSALVFGSVISGTGITAGTKISGITAGTSLTLSANATATGNTWLTMTGMVLEPLDFVAPANSQPLLAVSSGGIIKETDMRVNFVRCLDYTRTPVEVTGGHTTNDQQMAAPVTLTNPVAQGGSANIGTAGAGAWIIRGAAHTTADIASAALTTVGQTTSTGVDVTGNTGSMQINVDISAAVTGTSPRMFTRLQGSFDGGTTWYNVYDIGVITNNTTRNNDSPVIPIEFRAIRYIRDVRGTSPSFTNAVNRNVRPMELSKRQRRLLDRVVGLTTTTASTEWLYVGGCTKAQLMSTAISAQTVAAVVKVQLCQGDPNVAGNWYDIPSAPTLTTSASSFVVTAPFDIGNAKFARLVPTTAGTGIVVDTYELSLTAWE